MKAAEKTTEIILLERDYGKYSDPSSINCGDCWVWALVLQSLLEGAQLRAIDHTAHIFVYFKGKYYDSEHPQGVKDWMNLNCCRRNDWRCTRDRFEVVTAEDVLRRRFGFCNSASIKTIESLKQKARQALEK